METWAIIYEYCEDHPNCRSTDCQKTVVVQARIRIPEINLIKTLTHNDEQDPGSSRIVSDRSTSLVPSGIFVHTVPAASKKLSHRFGRHSSGIPHPKTFTLRMPIPFSQFAGIMLLALGIGGFVGPLIPEIRLETQYFTSQAKSLISSVKAGQVAPLPKSAPVVFEPLKAPNGTIITPVNNDFSLIIPKIGVNAPVVADVDPTKPKEYDEALLKGVAHASTSFFPDQNGTVYIFSHSTNYEWFVKDLNAVFYLVKNLDKGDTVVLIYKGIRYTYRITDKRVVPANKSNYLIPFAGKKNLILETCWPPGSIAERLLLFADLVNSEIMI